jgi:hypothetical protein
MRLKLLFDVLLISIGSCLFWEANKQFGMAFSMPEKWFIVFTLGILGIVFISCGLFSIVRGITTNA